MTVATFLAGFVFTALSALLRDQDDSALSRVSGQPRYSVALFVASIYIYDQLGAPFGFWTDTDKPRKFWRYLYRPARPTSRTVEKEQRGKTMTTQGRLADDKQEMLPAALMRTRLLPDGAHLPVPRHPRGLMRLAGFAALLVGTGARGPVGAWRGCPPAPMPLGMADLGAD